MLKWLLSGNKFQRYHAHGSSKVWEFSTRSTIYKEFLYCRDFCSITSSFLKVSPDLGVGTGIPTDYPEKTARVLPVEFSLGNEFSGGFSGIVREDINYILVLSSLIGGVKERLLIYYLNYLSRDSPISLGGIL